MELPFPSVVEDISPFATGNDAADKIRAAFCTFIGSDAFKLLYVACELQRNQKSVHMTH